MWKDEHTADILFDSKKEEVSVKNYTDNIFKLPFGVHKNITWAMFKDFLEDRCFPKTRADRQRVLDVIGVPVYDTRLIIQKTHGLMYMDFLWIRLGDEDKTQYKEVKIR
jgi:putative transcriptional regulator